MLSALLVSDDRISVAIGEPCTVKIACQNKQTVAAFVCMNSNNQWECRAQYCISEVAH